MGKINGLLDILIYLTVRGRPSLSFMLMIISVIPEGYTGRNGEEVRDL